MFEELLGCFNASLGEQNSICVLRHSVTVNLLYVCHPETADKEIYHRLFDVLLVIIAPCCVVIAVNNLNSDVALRKSSASFTCV